MENEEKRMISSYEVTQSIHIGRKEVVFGVDEKAEYPFWSATAPTTILCPQNG